MAGPSTLAMVMYLSKAVHRGSSDELLGMRLRQFMVLGYLERQAPARQQELCETFMLDPNNCVLLLNELEEAGWVERRRDTVDRRRHVVELTEKGRRALGRAREAQGALEDKVLTGLDADEREQLQTLLQKALTALQQREPVAS